jgi:hypothetical protein
MMVPPWMWRTESLEQTPNPLVLMLRSEPSTLSAVSWMPMVVVSAIHHWVPQIGYLDSELVIAGIEPWSLLDLKQHQEQYYLFWRDGEHE